MRTPAGVADETGMLKTYARCYPSPHNVTINRQLNPDGGYATTTSDPHTFRSRAETADAPSLVAFPRIFAFRSFVYSFTSQCNAPPEVRLHRHGPSSNRRPDSESL